MRMILRTNITNKQAAIIRLTAVLLAVVASGIFLAIMGFNPFLVYKAMIEGAFGTTYRLRSTVETAIPLIITSIGIMIAFKMKFWNIGAEGQILMGAFVASYFALYFYYLPKSILLPLMFIGGFVGGGLFALIAGLLKVHLGTNETIITLMLNYIAIKWITYLQYGPWKDPNGHGFPQIAKFADSGRLPSIFGIHIGFIIMIIIVIVVTIVLKKTKIGYKISVVGESEKTAMYAGMNVKKIITWAVFASGGICGITGMIEASAINGTLSVGLSQGYGFTAIITAWLSGLKTSIIVPVAVLFSGMIKGSSFIQSAFLIPQSVADIIQALILFFVIGSEFFIRYRLVRKNKEVA